MLQALFARLRKQKPSLEMVVEPKAEAPVLVISAPKRAAKPRVIVHWTAVEDEYLHKHYGKGQKTAAQIGAHLGRTAHAVRMQAGKQGLRSKYRRPRKALTLKNGF